MNDSIKARLEALGLTLPATEGESEVPARTETTGTEPTEAKETVAQSEQRAAPSEAPALAQDTTGSVDAVRKQPPTKAVPQRYPSRQPFRVFWRRSGLSHTARTV